WLSFLASTHNLVRKVSVLVDDFERRGSRKRSRAGLRFLSGNVRKPQHFRLLGDITRVSCESREAGSIGRLRFYLGSSSQSTTVETLRRLGVGIGFSLVPRRNTGSLTV